MSCGPDHIVRHDCGDDLALDGRQRELRMALEDLQKSKEHTGHDGRPNDLVSCGLDSDGGDATGVFDA